MADHINKQISGSLLKAAIPPQAILDFCNQPGFVHEVFMNLDCRIERSNLFETICTLLSKAAFPVGSTLGSVHLLSLEGIHSILAALASRSALIITHCILESLPCCHHHSSALDLKEINK